MNRKTKILLIIIVALIAFIIGASSCCHAQIEADYDHYSRWVTDNEDLFTDTEEVELTKMLSDFEKQTTVEISILTTDTYENEATIEDYAVWVGEKWGVGKKDSDNGLMIVISAINRKATAATGYGLEGYLPDLTVTKMIGNDLPPYFREEKYYEGTKVFVENVMAELMTYSAEGNQQIIKDREEQERIAREEASAALKSFLKWLLYIVIIVGITVAVIWLIRKAIHRQRLFNIRKSEMNKIYGLIEDDEFFTSKDCELPDELQTELESCKNLKVSDESVSRLDTLLKNINDFKDFVDSIDSARDIINGELTIGIDNLSKTEFVYCNKLFQEEIAEAQIAITNSKYLTSIKYTDEVFKDLADVSGVINRNLRKIKERQKLIASILEHHKKSDDIKLQLDENRTEYLSYLDKLKTLVIGSRGVFDFSFTSQREITFTYLRGAYDKLQEDDISFAEDLYHKYLNTSVLLFKNLELAKEVYYEYKLAVKETPQLLRIIRETITEIESKLKKSGVKSSRKTTLSNLEAELKVSIKIQHTDLIEYHEVVEDLLGQFKDLLKKVKRDHQNYEDEQQRKRDKKAREKREAAAAARRKRSSSSSSSSSGSYGGGSFGGGGGSTSW